MVIQRIGPMSCAKIVGTLYAAIGLVAGAVVSVIAVAGGFPDNTSGAAFGAIFGAAAIVLLPICYGALGFLTALAGAGLYNVFARRVGGVEIEVT